MSRLKDEIIEQLDRLGDCKDYCESEIKEYNKFLENHKKTLYELKRYEDGSDDVEFERSYDDGKHYGRNELAEAILKLINGEE